MTILSRETCAGEMPAAAIKHPLLGLLDSRLRQHGVSALRLRLGSGLEVCVGVRSEDRPIPLVRLNRWRAILRGWQGGLLGWAEGFIAGDWDCDQPLHVTDWAMANEAALESSFRGTPLSAAIARLYHRLRDNSRRGSRRNIAQHYDLGNDFYRQWLDETMSYSAALFDHPQQSLASAQAGKYQRVLEMLGPSANGRVLEIGCGWGGFAEAWAGSCSGSLHGITLSQAQLDYANQRMAARDEDRTSFALTDYRDTSGEFDAIVSIEMFEAVGEARWSNYFKTLRQRLKPGGSAVLQVITIADDRFESYRHGTDFIQRYIFPGGMLPSPSRFRAQVEKSGLQLTEVQTFGADYARTLQHWQRNFERNWPAIEALGFDQRFRRMWSYYLAYCESGFKAGAIDVQLCRIERH